MNIFTLARKFLGIQDKESFLQELSDRDDADRLKFISDFENRWHCIVDKILLEKDRKAILMIGDAPTSSYRELPWIPKAIGRLSHLEELYIKTTFIRTTNPWNSQNTRFPTEIPESLGDLVNLKILSLRGSKITKLPESIGNLSNLVSLDLQYVPISSLPDSFDNLKKLERLSLFGTSVDDFTILQQLPDLREIQLGGDVAYWEYQDLSLAEFKLKYCNNIHNWSERDRKMLESYRRM